LKVTTETVGTREVLLTIEPDPQHVQRALQKAAREISRRRPLPGYRPGRAPYGLVERVFGREAILSEALNDMGPSLYREAVEQASIEPLEQGQLELESADPVVLKVNIPLIPVVALGDYKSLRIDPEPEVSVTEEQIDQHVERVRRGQAQYQTVNRPVQLDDQIVASIKGTSDGEIVIDDEDAILDMQEVLEPPGFAEALLGMSQGETRKFSLAYPDGFENESLAGKNVSFSITVKTVREADLPEVNEDLAKAAGDYETMAEMREDIAVQLKQRLEREAQGREANAAIEALVAQSKVDYPKAAVEREVDIALDSRKARVRQAGFDFERYLQMIGSTEQQLGEELRPQAERTLVRGLVLAEFARAEELNVDEDELAGGMSRFAAAYGDSVPEVRERLQDRRVVLSIYNDMLTRKAVLHLTDMLTGRATLVEGTQGEDGAGDAESAGDEDGEADEGQSDSGPAHDDSERKTTEQEGPVCEVTDVQASSEEE